MTRTLEELREYGSLKTVSDEELLNDLIELSNRLGRRPRSKDVVNSNGLYHVSSYKTRFGTWSKALELAGMPIPKFDLNEYYQNNREKIRKQQREWREKNAEHLREYRRKYYIENRDKILKQIEQYRKEHPEKVKQMRRNAYYNEREYAIYCARKWKLENPDKARMTEKLSKYRRKGWGFNPLNEYFEGSEGHHTHRNGDHSEVIYIPYELHKSIYHSYDNDYSMNEINKLVFKWYHDNYGVDLSNENIG